MNVRVLASSGLAAVVTLSLFVLIQRLTTPTETGELIAITGPIVNFVRLKRDQDLILKKRVLPKRPARPRSVPPTPRLSKTDLPILARPLKMPRPQVDMNFDLAGPMTSLLPGEDVDAVPTFRMPPLYPAHAERMGVEGWVDLEFAVSKTGSVLNPHVIDANPAGVFDRSAKSAILKWRYRPKIVGGAAVEQTGVRVRIRFELEEQ